jgi:Protein of unknown function (DUF3096)
MVQAGLRRHAHVPIHRAPHRSLRNAAHLAAAIFDIFAAARNPKQATDVCYLRTGPEGRMQPSIPFPKTCPKTHSGDISMTITAAHIPAIVALIAGVLILIMPRLLNFVVAIYLILTGLIGLGVLRMFHM